MVVDGVLVAVEQVQRCDLDTVAEVLTALGEPVAVRLPGPARHQVEQPCLQVAVLVGGEVDHPGQLLGWAATVFDQELRHVVPHVFIDAEPFDAGESGFVVSSARGAATSSSCSVNTFLGQAGSSQRQVRLRHTSFTGRSKQGASTSTTSRRPWLCAITPQVLQPIGAAADSTATATRKRRQHTASHRRQKALLNSQNMTCHSAPISPWACQTPILAGEGEGATLKYAGQSHVCQDTRKPKSLRH